MDKRTWSFLILLIAVLGAGAAVRFGSMCSAPAPSPAADASPAPQSQDPPTPAVPAAKQTPAPAALPAAPTGLTEPELLEHLHQLSGTERMTWLANVVNKDRDFKPVERDSVNLFVIQKGTMATDVQVEIIARVGGKLRSITPDATMVKKGDRLFEIDDSERKAQLQKLNTAIAQASAAVRLATDTLVNLRNKTQADVREADLELKLVERDFKLYKGNDAEQKKKLQARTNQARLALEKAKSMAETLEAEVAADIKSKQANLDRVLAEHLQVEAEIARCVHTAPGPGMIVHHLALPGDAAQAKTLKPGDPISPGQLVLCVCDDLEHPHLAVRFDTTKTGKGLRPGLAAYVRVEAFPNRPFRGTVKSIGPPEAEVGSSVKLQLAKIAIRDENSELRPGMAGVATVVVDQRSNCLRLPLPLIVENGKQKYCFVLSGGEIKERAITTGLANDQFVEILTGLEEGERVLNLQTVLRRQAEYLKYHAK